MSIPLYSRQLLEESRTAIAEAGYAPSDPFPDNQELREGDGNCLIPARYSFPSLVISVVSKVYENVIFFGDFLLRMPDMTKQVLLFLFS